MPETNPEKRIAELIQVAAVALSWAQAIEEQFTAAACDIAESSDGSEP